MSRLVIFPLQMIEDIHLPEFQGIIRFYRQCRYKIGIVGISKTPKRLTKQLNRTFGQLVDVILAAEPYDEAFVSAFDSMIHELKVHVENALVVSNSILDLQYCKRRGAITVFYDRVSHAPTQVDCAPDFEISDLKQLMRIGERKANQL